MNNWMQQTETIGRNKLIFSGNPQVQKSSGSILKKNARTLIDNWLSNN